MWKIGVYNEENLPSHLVEDYKDLITKLIEGKNQVGDGTVEQTVNGISEDDAVEIAQEIMDFTHNLLNTPRRN